MNQIIFFHEFEIEIIKKKIKNIHLKINLEGKISLSAPKNTKDEFLIDFLESKLDWIRLNYKKAEAKNKFHNKQVIDGEKHYLFGKALTLKIIEEKVKKTSIYIENNEILVLKTRINANQKNKEKHLFNWYKENLIKETEKFFDKWENELEVSKKELVIKKMKGKWGYCETRRRVICLNSELAKRNLDFVEYVVLHEICHLLVPNHGPDFKKLLNTHMPKWKSIKSTEEL